jgi:hypothetical protein
MQRDKELSIRAAAKIYDVEKTTLHSRRNGRPARRDMPANSRKLTELEEKIII